MAVSFLDIAPKQATEMITIESMAGPADIELRGVSFTILADIAKKYPPFAKLIEGDGGSMISAGDAMPALIAAGLGHAGEQAYEDKVRSFPTADIMNMARTVIRLTFPAAAADPLSPAPEAAPIPDGADVVQMRQTSLRP